MNRHCLRRIANDAAAHLKTRSTLALKASLRTKDRIDHSGTFS
jgi:hypothetical protein